MNVAVPATRRVFEVRRDVEVELFDVHSAVRRVALGCGIDAGPNIGDVAALESVNVLGLGRMDNAKRRKRGGGNEDDSFHLVNQRGPRVGNPTPGAKEKKDRLAAVFAEKSN